MCVHARHREWAPGADRRTSRCARHGTAGRAPHVRDGFAPLWRFRRRAARPGRGRQEPAWRGQRRTHHTHHNGHWCAQPPCTRPARQAHRVFGACMHEILTRSRRTPVAVRGNRCSSLPKGPTEPDDEQPVNLTFSSYGLRACEGAEDRSCSTQTSLPHGVGRKPHLRANWATMSRPRPFSSTMRPCRRRG